MSKLNNIYFIGKSGQKYDFAVYSLDTCFNNIGAVYAFIKQTVDYNRTPQPTVYYIGITGSLHERLNGHDKLDDCVNHGANSVCVLPNSSNISRALIERDLIASYKPAFNDQLKV